MLQDLDGKGIRPDHENTVQTFKDMLKEQGLGEVISEVISLRQLKVEYKQFEAKTALCHRFDKFLPTTE